MFAPPSFPQVRLVPRFAVEQGVQPDGTKKLRAVDHYSWSPRRGRRRTRAQMRAESVNGHYEMPGAVAVLPQLMDVLIIAHCCTPRYSGA